MISILFLIQTLTGLVPLSSIHTDATDFRVDQLNNVYLIHNRYIEKMSPDGKLLFRTSDPGYGQITSMEVSDPLKPFLFFRDQGIIYPMDNTQSLQGGVLELFKTGMQVDAVGWSRDNHYWLWDTYNSELVRVDRALNRVNATGNLRTLLGITLAPNQIVEVGGYWVYVVDPENGIFIFDVYGNYYTRKEIKVPSGIQVHDKFILYSDGQQIHYLEKSMISETTFPLPESKSGRVLQMNGKIYFLSNEQLQVYAVN